MHRRQDKRGSICFLPKKQNSKEFAYSFSQLSDSIKTLGSKTTVDPSVHRLHIRSQRHNSSFFSRLSTQLLRKDGVSLNHKEDGFVLDYPVMANTKPLNSNGTYQPGRAMFPQIPTCAVSLPLCLKNYLFPPLKQPRTPSSASLSRRGMDAWRGDCEQEITVRRRTPRRRWTISSRPQNK